MYYSDAVNSYQKTRVETVDDLKLVIMCYDATIRDLEDAKKLHQGQAMVATYEKIRHAQDIITELLVGLDYDRGGVIAQNLSKLYNFLLRQLVGINSRKDTAMYDHLIRILSELRSAWEQVRLNSLREVPVPTPAPARAWGVSA